MKYGQSRGTSIRENIQESMMAWATNTFGQIAQSPQERSRRFAEEALELLQATGLEKADLLKLVDYTYARPVGQVFQEVGGVCVSLMCLAEWHKVSVEKAESAEVARCLTRSVDEWRAKHAQKVNAGVAG